MADPSLPESPPPPPLHRLPCHPPLPEVATRFGLLLRRLKVLHGPGALQQSDAQITLGLLDHCAASEDDRKAVRAFSPLITCGFLGLLQQPAPERAALAHAIARHVTVRPEQLEKIASRIAPLLHVKPTSAIEALALARGSRRTIPSQAVPYNANLWLGVMAILAAAAAGLGLMAYGARRSLADRSSRASAMAPSLITLQASAPRPTGQSVTPFPGAAPSGQIPRQ